MNPTVNHKLRACFQDPLPKVSTRIAMGIMSGTSADGADYVTCEVSGTSMALLEHWYAAYPSTLREKVLEAAENRIKSHDLSRLHHRLGEFYALNARHGHSTPKPSVVGLHGQTIHHQVDEKAKTSLQLGEPSWLAESMGVPVVYGFRNRDICLGGQGAPLATLFHYLAFGRPNSNVCVQNLGGIGNVTSIQWGSSDRSPRFLSFDTGPGNMLMDGLACILSKGGQLRDSDGALAAKGRPNRDLIDRMLVRDRFIRKRPPKSTGRERYGGSYLAGMIERMQIEKLSSADQMATLAWFTAASIAENYKLHVPKPIDEVVISGGGTKNPYLIGAIYQELKDVCNPNTRLLLSSDQGWPVETVEAAAFALLACLRLDGIPGNVPATTGAKRTCLLGNICAG